MKLADYERRSQELALKYMRLINAKAEDLQPPELVPPVAQGLPLAGQGPTQGGVIPDGLR